MAIVSAHYRPPCPKPTQLFMLITNISANNIFQWAPYLIAPCAATLLNHLITQSVHPSYEIYLCCLIVRAKFPWEYNMDDSDLCDVVWMHVWQLRQYSERAQLVPNCLTLTVGGAGGAWRYCAATVIVCQTIVVMLFGCCCSVLGNFV